MKDIIPQIVGLAAVTTFFLSYQQKKRSGIIIMNVLSRFLYILQYILLGAFSGVALDLLGALSSIVAGKKDRPFVARHLKAIIIILNCSMIAAGVTICIINKSLLDLLPVAGVLLHTGAFWMSDERSIRRVSLLGSPFWFVYNFVSRAYGSAIGDVLSMVSMITAMIKYRDKKEKTKDKEHGEQNV